LEFLGGLYGNSRSDGFPTTMKSIKDRPEMAVVHLSKLFKGVLISGVKFTYLDYQIGSQFLRMAENFSASLLKHIARIVFMSSKEEMFGINAMAYIARMAHNHSFRNRSIVNFPGNAMSFNAPSIWSMKLASSTSGSSASPKPTLFCFSHKFEECFFNRLGWLIDVTFSTPRIMFLDHRRTIQAFLSKVIHFVTSTLIVEKGELYGN
jgi:hypothetical protein